MQGVEDEFVEKQLLICGGKDYLDKVPHGFDILRGKRALTLANYLFSYSTSSTRMRQSTLDGDLCLEQLQEVLGLLPGW